MCMGKTDSFEFQREEAEFWAWLNEGHIIPEPITSDTKGKANRRFKVVSTEEMKLLVLKALENGDQRLSNELLRIASEPQPISEGITLRKSMRTGNGEYLKLLYVKTLEKTSFSDVIVRMLMPQVRSFLESIRKQEGEKLKNKSERFDHLTSLMDNWQNINPDSRSRSVDEIGSIIKPHYPGKLEDIKVFLSEFIFTELELKVFGKHPRRMKSDDNTFKIFEEFKNKWVTEFDASPMDGIYLMASINKKNSDKLLITPNIMVSVSFTEKEKEKLLRDFEEENVLEFLNIFNKKSQGDGETENDNQLYKIPEREIYCHREISLPAATAHIIDPDNFEVEPPSKLDVLERIENDSNQLRHLIVELGKSMELDAYDHFHKEIESIKQIEEKSDSGKDFDARQVIAFSEQLIRFTKLAVKVSKTPYDFSTIMQINSLRTKIINYRKIMNFTEDLVYASIQRLRVVSFYISKDLWRFLPLAIKGKDWINIANDYLITKRE